jgi:hypothetical protein
LNVPSNCQVCNAATDLGPTPVSEEGKTPDATHIIRNIVLCAGCQAKHKAGSLKFKGGKPI